jgi:integrase
MVTRNVADAVEPPIPVRTEMRALNEEELRRLLDAAKTPTAHCVRAQSLMCDSAFYAGLVFMAATGARRGECLGLRWADVDVQTGAVAIRRSLEQTRAGLNFKQPKSGKARVVRLGRLAVRVLKAHHAAQGEDRLYLGPAYADNDLVFARRDGKPYSPHTFGDAFRALVRRSKVPSIRLHDLRHTHASLLGKHRVPLKVVSERLGHSTIAITADVYSHVFASQDEEAASAFDAVLFGATGDLACDTDVIRLPVTG